MLQAQSEHQPKSTISLPFFVGRDPAQELLHLGLLGQLEPLELLLEVLAREVVREDAARAADQVVYVLATPHYHVGELQLTKQNAVYALGERR